MITQTTQGSVTIFTLDMPLDTDIAETLVDRVTELPRGGRPQIVFDMAGAPLMDSAGCEALLDIQDHVSGVGGVAHLASLGPLCKDILTATRVSESFRLFDGVNQAIASFAK